MSRRDREPRTATGAATALGKMSPFNVFSLAEAGFFPTAGYEWKEIKKGY